MKKIFNSTLLLIFALIVTSCTNQQQNQTSDINTKQIEQNQNENQGNTLAENDERCNWFPGDCKNKCISDNYLFDQKTKKCIKYPGWIDGKIGCCTKPPFKTIEECQKICEE